MSDLWPRAGQSCELGAHLNLMILPLCNDLVVLLRLLAKIEELGKESRL